MEHVILLVNLLRKQQSNDDISKSKVKDSLESYIDKVNVIGSYENEKFYYEESSIELLE